MRSRIALFRLQASSQVLPLERHVACGLHREIELLAKRFEDSSQPRLVYFMNARGRHKLESPLVIRDTETRPIFQRLADFFILLPSHVIKHEALFRTNRLVGV